MTSVFPDGLITEEAFGSPTINQTIYPVGAGTGQAYGTLAIVPDKIVRLTGIDAADVFGTASFLVPQTVVPDTIVPPELVPTPLVVIAEDADISVDGFTNTVFGTPVLFHDADAQPDGFGGEEFGEPSVWADPGPEMYPYSVDSEYELGTPTIIIDKTVTPESFVAGAVGTPTVKLKLAQSIYPDSFDDSAVSEPSVVLDQTVVVSSIAEHGIGSPSIKRKITAMTADKVLTVSASLAMPTVGFNEIDAEAVYIGIGTLPADIEIRSLTLPIIDGDDFYPEPEVYSGNPQPYSLRAMTLVQITRGSMHTDYNLLPVNDVIVGDIDVTGKATASAEGSDDTTGFVWKAPPSSGVNLFVWEENNGGPSWNTQGSFSPYNSTIKQHTDTKESHNRNAIVFHRSPNANMYLDLGDEYDAITLMIGIQFADYAKRHNIFDAGKLGRQYWDDDKGVNFKYDEGVPQRARILAGSNRVVATTSQGKPTANKHLVVRNDGRNNPRVLFAVFNGDNSALGWIRGNDIHKDLGKLEPTTFRHLILGRHQDNIGKDHAMRATLFEIRIYTRALDMDEVKSKAGVIQARYGFTDGWLQ